jgi:hypothetical protein
VTDRSIGARRKQIVAYIRQHHATYAREAITDALRSAGFDLEEIKRGWAAIEVQVEPQHLQPSWQLMLWLLALGTLGAFAVWQPQQFNVGWIAATIYFAVAGIALAIGYAVVWLADRGHTLIAALSVVVIGLALGLFIAGGTTLIMLVIAALFLAIALALLLAGPRRRQAGLIAASVPVLLWLVVTGTCYAPLLGGG